MSGASSSARSALLSNEPSNPHANVHPGKIRTIVGFGTRTAMFTAGLRARLNILMAIGILNHPGNILEILLIFYCINSDQANEVCRSIERVGLDPIIRRSSPSEDNHVSVGIQRIVDKCVVEVTLKKDQNFVTFLGGQPRLISQEWKRNLFKILSWIPLIVSVAVPLLLALYLSIALPSSDCSSTNSSSTQNYSKAAHVFTTTSIFFFFSFVQLLFGYAGFRDFVARCSGRICCRCCTTGHREDLVAQRVAAQTAGADESALDVRENELHRISDSLPCNADDDICALSTQSKPVKPGESPPPQHANLTPSVSIRPVGDVANASGSEEGGGDSAAVAFEASTSHPALPSSSHFENLPPAPLAPPPYELLAANGELGLDSHIDIDLAKSTRLPFH